MTWFISAIRQDWCHLTGQNTELRCLLGLGDRPLNREHDNEVAAQEDQPKDDEVLPNDTPENLRVVFQQSRRSFVLNYIQTRH